MAQHKNLFNWFWLLAIVCALVVYAIAPVLVPLVAAILLAYLINPMVVFCQKWVKSRLLALSLLLGLLLLVLAVLSIWVLPKIWRQGASLIEQMPAAWAWLNQFLHKASDLLGVGYQLMPFSELKAQLLNVATQYIGLGQAGSVVGFIAHSGAGVISAVGMAVLTVVMTCYLLLDWERFVAQLFTVVPLPWQGEVASVSAQCHQVVGAFMRGQLMVMLLLSIFYAVCLQVMGLKVGFLIGVLTGVLAIVPYLGALVSVALALVAVLLQFGFAWLPLSLLVIIYMVGHVLEGYVLQPLLLGDKIGLSPVAVVMAVLIGGHLAGIVGMFIALPLAAVLVVIIKHLYQHYQQSHFYTGK